MNILSRLFGGKTERKEMKGGRKKGLFFHNVNNSLSSLDGYENYKDAYNLNTYRESLWVFLGVSMIRDTISAIEFELYKIIDRTGGVEEVYDDPIVDLINNPNERQTKMEFWKNSIANYLLAGEAYWYLQRETPGAFPVAMVNLRPDLIEVLISADKKEVVGYKLYQSNGQSVVLLPEDVLVIKNIDPVNPLRGTGFVYPATRRIITEREASKYQAETFISGGRPDVIVMTDEEVDDEKGLDFRTRWHKIFGSNKGSNPMLAGNNIKDIKTLNVSPKEMEYLKTQTFLRDDLLAALRINKAMITSDQVNLANAKVARINYIKEACLPILDTFIDVINNKFIHDVAPDKFLTYESPVQEDRELLLKEATQLYSRSGDERPIINQNEARAILNYDPVEGGDDFGVPVSAIEKNLKLRRLRGIAMKHIRSRKVLLRKFVAMDAVRDFIISESEKPGVDRQMNSIFPNDEKRLAYAKSFNDSIDRKADSMHSLIDFYNRGLSERIIKRQTEIGLDPDNIFNLTEEVIEAKKIFTPYLKALYSRVGQEALDEVARGFEAKASERFYTIPEILAEIDLRIEFFIISMLDTDFGQLKNLIASGMAEGMGILEIGRSIRGYFDDMSVARARTIARTETGRLMSKATRDSYQQSTLVTGVEWLTAEDAKVRSGSAPDNHVMNNKIIVAKDASFPNGEKYPGELTINCRCALAPAV